MKVKNPIIQEVRFLEIQNQFWLKATWQHKQIIRHQFLWIKAKEQEVETTVYCCSGSKGILYWEWITGERVWFATKEQAERAAEIMLHGQIIKEYPV